jgi:transcriptional regulator with XRE-family HTH domain
MRPSPRRHSLAVLRTIIGLTQKEMAQLLKCSTPTVQAIELGKLKMSDRLALAATDATGIDTAWLMEGNPSAPPRKGPTAGGTTQGTGDYTRLDYEFHRAFLESPIATPQQIRAAGARIEKYLRKDGAIMVPLPIFKATLLKVKVSLLRARDRQTVAALKRLLEQTAAQDNADLVRWKIRTFLQGMAAENSVQVDLTTTDPQATTSSKTPAIEILAVDDPNSKRLQFHAVMAPSPAAKPSAEKPKC